MITSKVTRWIVRDIFLLPYCLLTKETVGMSYNELSVYGRLRKVNKLGPYGMFTYLLHEWGHLLSPREIYEKVRWFHWW